MAYRFSRRSRGRMKGVHPDLILVAGKGIELFLGAILTLHSAACACTDETKIFPGWSHPPTSDIYIYIHIHHPKSNMQIWATRDPPSPTPPQARTSCRWGELLTSCMGLHLDVGHYIYIYICITSCCMFIYVERNMIWKIIEFCPELLS